MYYFLGWPFVTDDQAVTCAGATNPSYLTDWFTSRKLVTASATSAVITIDLTGTNEVDYVVLYAVTVPDAALTPTWRAQVYDALAGGGSELLDSGTLSAVQSFAVSSALDLVRPEPAQLIYRWTSKATGREEPLGTSLAKSIKITLATTSSAVWSVGYVAAGKSVALSNLCKVGAGFDPSSSYGGRSTALSGGGVTDSYLTATTAYPLNIRTMSYDDEETLRTLFARVLASRPFFLYPSVPPTSRPSQLGLVRFTSTKFDLRQLGTMLTGASRHSLSSSVTPWR